MEHHYRPCACRSSTPFLGEHKHGSPLSAHDNDESGKPYRTFFQHDRDKILYCKSFRRLRLKTQIYPEHVADHLRTRLDHTMEVSQIARHVARQLQLNEDLADAISLAHDIGHTPFAHSGERALHKFLINKRTELKKSSKKKIKLNGFKHNWQGLRQVDLFEKTYPECDGLNLTRAVRIGILIHTGLTHKEWPKEDCSCDMRPELDFVPESKRCAFFEAQIIRESDAIAQVIHDFEDAILSGALDLEDVILHPTPAYPLIIYCKEKLKERGVDPGRRDFLDNEKKSIFMARLRSEMIYQLTLDLLKASSISLADWEKKEIGRTDRDNAIKRFNKFVEDAKEFPQIINLNKLRPIFEDQKRQLQDWMVNTERVRRMDGKAHYLIRHILEVYLKSPDQAPQAVLEQYVKKKEGETEASTREEQIRKLRGKELQDLQGDEIYIRAAVDYVGGMTDRYALQEYDRLYSAVLSKLRF